MIEILLIIHVCIAFIATFTVKYMLNKYNKTGKTVKILGESTASYDEMKLKYKNLDNKIIAITFICWLSGHLYLYLIYKLIVNIVK